VCGNVTLDLRYCLWECHFRLKVLCMGMSQTFPPTFPYVWAMSVGMPPQPFLVCMCVWECLHRHKWTCLINECVGMSPQTFAHTHTQTPTHTHTRIEGGSTGTKPKHHVGEQSNGETVRHLRCQSIWVHLFIHAFIYVHIHTIYVHIYAPLTRNGKPQTFQMVRLWDISDVSTFLYKHPSARPYESYKIF